jgi:penicillin-binding protein-related factor A (putative recombinase)
MTKILFIIYIFTLTCNASYLLSTNKLTTLYNQSLIDQKKELEYLREESKQLKLLYKQCMNYKSVLKTEVSYE